MKTETLRKFPPLTTHFRICTKDYYLPDYDTTIDAGTVIFIPAIGFHFDPDVFPDPEKFDPTRFSPETKSTRDPFYYMPFGEGPRICIGEYEQFFEKFQRYQSFVLFSRESIRTFANKNRPNFGFDEVQRGGGEGNADSCSLRPKSFHNYAEKWNAVKINFKKMNKKIFRL